MKSVDVTPDVKKDRLKPGVFIPVPEQTYTLKEAIRLAKNITENGGKGQIRVRGAWCDVDQSGQVFLDSDPIQLSYWKLEQQWQVRDAIKETIEITMGDLRKAWEVEVEIFLESGTNEESIFREFIKQLGFLK